MDILAYLKSRGIEENKLSFQYELESGNKVNLQKKAIISAFEKRLGSRGFEVLKKLDDADILDYMKDMVEYQVYAGVFDKTWSELSNEYENVSVEFLQWLSNELNINEQQALCNHNVSNQFSESGIWVNFVGKCSKCLSEGDNFLENVPNFEIILKAYNRDKK